MRISDGESMTKRDSDVPFHCAILWHFIRDAPPNAIVVDDSKAQDSEHMKVIPRRGYLKSIGKLKSMSTPI